MGAMNPTAEIAGHAAGPRLAPRAIVLVCDDDRLVLVTLSSALKSAGYAVIEADNGDDAILLARQHRPDLALLDIRMDGKSGLDVASYLRDYVGTPFMFLSAFSDEAFIDKAREFGALDYLVKPIDIERIAPAVEAALRRPRGPSRPVAGEDSTAALAGAAMPAPMPTPAPTPATTPAPGAALADAAAHRQIAVGILMERFRLTRSGAQRRLAQMADDASRTEDSLAAELVRSIDTLNSAGR
jgi:response regulator NasT